jgi:oligopeptide/dipeptide ABC transporter ATP-binding protein
MTNPKTKIQQPESPARLLEVRDLTVAFPIENGMRRVVAGINYTIEARRTIGLVGESGCGKSMSALALMGLVPAPGRVSGSLRLEGQELLGQSEQRWRRTRGRRIAMVFQEPMSSLNPVMPVGRQIAEVMVLHQGLGWRAAGERAVELLSVVKIPSPRERAHSYPHQLSGGMCQRAMIAMALACRPALLITDEPTTALDVTIQAQILDLILDLQAEFGTAVQFISHNLAVVSEVADEIIVMHAGRIVERAPAAALFAGPRHPYTQGLIATVAGRAKRSARLRVIPGSMPSSAAEASGCQFADRCFLAHAGCHSAEPPLDAVSPGHLVACFEARS